jgi:acetaldehyde dehydrogenase (acetylating)
MRRIKVAIIGTGNIGTDLCERLLKDNRFHVVAMIGRRADSEGLMRFKGKVENLLHKGAESLASIAGGLDGVFDATSAYDHLSHWTICLKNSVWMIDLTPSKVGNPMVPSLIGKLEGFNINSHRVANYSMVTCGGQSSAALVYAFSKHSKNIQEIEISSSIASLSAGPATRRNIDQYISSTEDLATRISASRKVKAILVINPSTPPVMMRTTVQMKVDEVNVPLVLDEMNRLITLIQRYVPGYEMTVEPLLSSEMILSATVRVVGSGYFLPSYAGNLDIINAAAVETASLHFEKTRG